MVSQGRTSVGFQPKKRGTSERGSRCQAEGRGIGATVGPNRKSLGFQVRKRMASEEVPGAWGRAKMPERQWAKAGSDGGPGPELRRDPAQENKFM